jgi:hypothetical protein
MVGESDPESGVSMSLSNALGEWSRMESDLGEEDYSDEKDLWPGDN